MKNFVVIRGFVQKKLLVKKNVQNLMERGRRGGMNGFVVLSGLRGAKVRSFFLGGVFLP